MRRRISTFIAIVQSVLFAVHLFLYETWRMFWRDGRAQGNWKAQIVFAFLSVNFLAVSLLGRSRATFLIRKSYSIAAIWLGFVNFAFLSGSACWIVYGGLRIAGYDPDRRAMGEIFLCLAILATLYGLVNASRIRVKKITVHLANLPDSWRGRVAALVSDLHLGHVRNLGFIRRIIGILSRLNPDIVFITGDLYDGVAVDLDGTSKPWADINPPLGTYFITGNHEEFSNPTKYLDALQGVGVHILNNEKVIVDGLQLVGVHYRDAVYGPRFQAHLQQAHLDRRTASVLLVHEPRHLEIAETEGISLQLSGHTHRGQMFPFTRIVARIYKQYAYGLQKWGGLTVYTTSGAGTWGPPMRVGTNPEIVVIRFD